MRSCESLGHAVCGDCAFSAASHLEDWIRVVLHAWAHLEEQAAKGLVAEEIATLAVFVEEGLAFFVGKAAANTVQDCHESLEVNQSFLLEINELEGIVWTNAFVLLDLCALSHSLKDSYFQLQDALIGHSPLE